ncbi:MAG: hypothetical protein M1833_005314 [Piccolia ochrophora]|nr:MAG: hypothetical protein M1833_005314 [Piccolia ochrophora]
MKILLSYSYAFLAFLPLSVFALPSLEGPVLKPLTARAVSLVDCLAGKNVPVSLLSSSSFPELAEPYNLRLAYTPAAIALPTTPKHVSDAVTCASTSGIKVQAKSGGHSYASHSSGGKDGSLVVDLRYFHDVVLDTATGVARVGGGVRLGNLATAIHNQGKRALPHGTCPGVGIGGHFTNGGYGLDSRLWGLALDTIVGMEVILADGKFVNATPSSNLDLFYALRGAASSFGIITTFYLQTQPAPDTVVNFAFSIPDARRSTTAAVGAFSRLQEFALNASVVNRQLAFGVYLAPGTFTLSGTYFDGIENFKNKVMPEMLRGLPAPSTSTVVPLGWLESLTRQAGGPLLVSETEYDEHDTFFAKSVVTQEARPLTQRALESFFTYADNEGSRSPSPWFSIINLYGGPDSQINAVPASASAYDDRTSLWVFQNYGFNSQLPFDPAIVTFVDGLNTAVTSAQPDGDFRGYANYVDPSLSAAEAHRLYYLPQTYRKLVGLKRKYDPREVFWNPQAVMVGY